MIGDPVNEAARLAELATRVPGGLVVAARAVDAADPQEAAQWRTAEQVVLRGRTEPTLLAVPTGPASSGAQPVTSPLRP